VPKLFPIKLEVEEIALGAVLRKLHETAGVIKINLDLDGGPQQPNGRATEMILAILTKGPASRDDIAMATGISRTRLYAAIATLKQKHLIKAIGKHAYALSDKAARELGGEQPQGKPLALPAPKRKDQKRASPGVARTTLLVLLVKSPGLRTMQIREALSQHGMSPKSISGIIERGKTDAVIKKNGEGWELTAKGQKLASAALAASAVMETATNG
jgi:biotin operon repressor